MKKYPLNKVEYYTHFRELIETLPEGREDAPGISWFTRKGEQQGVTLGKFREDVRSLQTVLTARGLAGKHIAILGENSYEWLLVYFAATYCGAVAVCVDVEQPDDTIRQMLEMADVSAMFFMPSLEDVCAPCTTAESNAFYLSGKGTRLNVQDLIAEFLTAETEAKGGVSPAPSNWEIVYTGDIVVGEATGKYILDLVSDPATLADGDTVAIFYNAGSLLVSNVASGNYNASSNVASATGSYGAGSSPINTGFESREININVTGTLRADGNQLVTVIENENKRRTVTT